MRLTKLQAENFRNFTSLNLELHPTANLIVGGNGSGKTSLLETVYFLATSRSLRGPRIDPLLKAGTDYCLVSAAVYSERDGDVSLGIRREANGTRAVKVNGQSVHRVSELARYLPTLVLGPTTINLLAGAPDERRNFLNQGMFHVEHSFTEIWRKANRALQQRNTLLKDRRSPREELEAWTEQFIALSEQIDSIRTRYFEQFLPVFTKTYRFLMPLEGVKCEYVRGWDSQRSLRDILEDQYESDRMRKFTQSGFQRADIRLTYQGKPVAQVCSRGELKMLSWSAVLAQGSLISEQAHPPIYLVDELTAELDQNHQATVVNLLIEKGGQVLVTGTHRDSLEALWGNACGKLFHVEHGSIRELEKRND